MDGEVPLCYHAGFSKKKCEEILGNIAKDGTYLLRDSETAKGALCLCVYKQNIVYTYRVLKSSRRYSLITAEGVKEVYFSTMKELLSHYEKTDQGLVINLCTSVNRAPAPLIQEQVSGMEHIYDNDYNTYVTVLPS